MKITGPLFLDNFRRVNGCERAIFTGSTEPSFSHQTGLCFAGNLRLVRPHLSFILNKTLLFQAHISAAAVAKED